MHGWPSILRRRKWVSRIIVYSLLTNCAETSVFGSYWDLIFYCLWTNLLVRERNGQNLVTNSWRVSSLTFITHVNTSNILMLETLSNNADWDCFKTPMLLEILKIPSQQQEEFCAFSEVTRLCQTVGCARNRFQFHTVQQKLKLFSRCRFTHGWNPSSWSLEFNEWGISSSPNQNNKTKDVREPRIKPGGKSSTKHAKTNPNNAHQSFSDQHWSRSIKRDTFWFQWGQWHRDENDNKRLKSHNETCVKNPQSCFRLVVWQD